MEEYLILQEVNNPTTSAERLWELSQFSLVPPEKLGSHPNAPLKLLEKLLESEEEVVREVIGQHPNLSPYTLFSSRGKKYPRSFWKNPAWPLWLISTPNLLEQMPKNILCDLLCFEEIREELCTEFTPGTTPVWTHEYFSSVVRKALLRLPLTRVQLATWETTPQAILTLLAKDECDAVRERVADTPSTPSFLLELLAIDSSVSVRIGVARNASTPSLSLSLLARDTHENVRYWVAQNISTDPDTRRLLAKDIRKHVRDKAEKSFAKKV